ncbi:MAG: SDR family NAD(P)-dependent oxidoreductase [Rhodothermales bacterium]|nr:SDR family NAD(P)-dependent oxidoreductase [Rhodothermales bacterium]
MDLGLTDKVALVTGGSRGIGRGIATALAEEGCRLVLCARGEDALNETAGALRARGAEVLALPLDLTDAGAPARLVEAAAERFGRLDAVVNNVGGNRRKPFAETTDDDWEAILDLNLRAHIRTSRAAIPHLRAAGGGAILFVSSIFGREAGGPGLSIYNTTKSALISLAKIMALELAQDGIRVNSLAPGSIRFPGGSWDRRVQADPEAMEQFVAENLPVGRFGTVEEVANVAAFLCSERASLVTGACLNVDGGQSRSLI